MVEMLIAKMRKKSMKEGKRNREKRKVEELKRSLYAKAYIDECNVTQKLKQRNRQ